MMSSDFHVKSCTEFYSSEQVLCQNPKGFVVKAALQSERGGQSQLHYEPVARSCFVFMASYALAQNAGIKQELLLVIIQVHESASCLIFHSLFSCAIKSC